MSEIAGTGMSVGKSNVSHQYDGFEHWKYPLSVGADTGVDDVNFNSHKTSEYAVERMSNIDGQTAEPFIMFEFMKINEDMATEKMKEGSSTVKRIFGGFGIAVMVEKYI